jgi:hypothetical protein
LLSNMESRGRRHNGRSGGFGAVVPSGCRRTFPWSLDAESGGMRPPTLKACCCDYSRHTCWNATREG